MRIPISATACGMLLKRSQPAPLEQTSDLPLSAMRQMSAPRPNGQMHQVIITTTITVVTYMIRSAFRWTPEFPLMFSHQNKSSRNGKHRKTWN